MHVHKVICVCVHVCVHVSLACSQATLQFFGVLTLKLLEWPGDLDEAVCVCECFVSRCVYMCVHNTV